VTNRAGHHREAESYLARAAALEREIREAQEQNIHREFDGRRIQHLEYELKVAQIHATLAANRD
jgi:hypothetical protein